MRDRWRHHSQRRFSCRSHHRNVQKASSIGAGLRDYVFLNSTGKSSLCTDLGENKVTAEVKNPVVGLAHRRPAITVAATGKNVCSEFCLRRQRASRSRFPDCHNFCNIRVRRPYNQFRSESLANPLRDIIEDAVQDHTDNLAARILNLLSSV